MRIYKIGNRYIDLDHVLSVTEPRIGYISNNSCYEHLFFEVIMMFRDEPIIIPYSVDIDEREKWVDEYFKDNPTMIRHNLGSYGETKWLYTQKPIFEVTFNQFLHAWKNKSM